MDRGSVVVWVVATQLRAAAVVSGTADLTRYRKALIRARTSEVNRLHKVLEGAGVKLATVASDVMGVSGREMMCALIKGVADPQVSADPARARLRTKIPELRKALTARFREHHALLARMLAHVQALEAEIGPDMSPLPTVGYLASWRVAVPGSGNPLDAKVRPSPARDHPG